MSHPAAGSGIAGYAAGSAADQDGWSMIPLACLLRGHRTAPLPRARPMSRGWPLPRGPPGEVVVVEHTARFPREGIPLRRFVLVAVLALAMVAFAALPAWAGSPHFVSNTVTVTKSGNTL